MSVTIDLTVAVTPGGCVLILDGPPELRDDQDEDGPCELADFPGLPSAPGVYRLGATMEPGDEYNRITVANVFIVTWYESCRIVPSGDVVRLMQPAGERHR